MLVYRPSGCPTKPYPLLLLTTDAPSQETAVPHSIWSLLERIRVSFKKFLKVVLLSSSSQWRTVCPVTYNISVVFYHPSNLKAC
ncbi:hypothetical protein Pst134EA_000876 [Puccinia striiformis f. sp. tritici]|uniref:hypothetical protein n=1 Tax=Puccinia striiformis f. sp. tritici TaxID=168172 RepID=UPI0020089FAB|nr:hypothetical protein Pst134EA_000876 [Puccinia striiformis f. sp. tritici]KAH9473811.1 hypothetical protein Pst134EA_000876 [Puccinia striiformis f. sp. tritici]